MNLIKVTVALAVAVAVTIFTSTQLSRSHPDPVWPRLHSGMAEAAALRIALNGWGEPVQVKAVRRDGCWDWSSPKRVLCFSGEQLRYRDWETSDSLTP